MSCPALTSLSAAAAAVQALPVPTGLGADVVLDEQVHELSVAVAALQCELAVRMAARERAAQGASDVRGDAVRAGLDPRRAGLLRRVGVFVDRHPDVEHLWRSGAIRLEQVELLRTGTGKVPADRRRLLVVELLPLLPGLDEPATRTLVEFAVDQLAPGDPDHEELSDHAARRLAWSTITGGGVAFEGYLPAAEGAAFTTAIAALVESLRVAGDSVTPAQRRADGLAALVAAATEQGLPSGGGLPAALTLTVSLTEAARIAARDPARHAAGIHLRPHGQSTLDAQPVGDAAVRFGLCCAAITPILTDQPDTAPERSEGGQWVDGEASDPVPGHHGGHQGPGGGASRPAAWQPGLGQPEAPPRTGGRSSTPTAGLPPAAGTPPHPRGSTQRQPRAVSSLLDRIARTPVRPLAVGRSVRLATAAQRHALRVRDRGCVIPGCDIDAAYTQPHHVVGWAIGGTTDLDQLVSLCWVHHRLTELGRFTFHGRAEGQPRPPGSLEHPHWWINPPTPVAP